MSFLDDPDSYDVGYKKPPKSGKFQKGKSGNPKGRPPNKLFHHTFIDLLNEEVVINVNGEKTKIPVKEAILKKLLIDSMNGKTGATKNFIEIMKHLTAMPPL